MTILLCSMLSCRSGHYTKLLIGPRRTAREGHKHLHIEEFLVLNKIEMIRMGDRNIIELEQGWNHMRKGIAKLKNILEGRPEQPLM